MRQYDFMKLIYVSKEIVNIGFKAKFCIFLNQHKLLATGIDGQKLMNTFPLVTDYNKFYCYLRRICELLIIIQRDHDNKLLVTETYEIA